MECWRDRGKRGVEVEAATLLATLVLDSGPVRLAYADPPYPGMGHFYEGGREVNHRLLVAYLCDEYDGWALSTASTTLQNVLADCPPDVRVGAWTKPFAVYKPGVNPGYCWEPVIFRGGRKRTREERTVRDWCAVNITMGREFVGAKPHEFCWWVFDLLGVTADDEFTDVFPGSGAVSRALDGYLGRITPEPGTLFDEAA